MDAAGARKRDGGFKRLLHQDFAGCEEQPRCEEQRPIRLEQMRDVPHGLVTFIGVKIRLIWVSG